MGLDIELGVSPGRQKETVAPIVPVGLPHGVQPDLDPWGPFYLMDPDILAAGGPSHATVASAADLALLLQALYHSGLWKSDAVEEGTRQQVDMEVTGDFERGQRLRMGLFVLLGAGPTLSDSTFGHHGTPCQVAWCDPETGLSFAFTTNGYPGIWL